MKKLLFVLSLSFVFFAGEVKSQALFAPITTTNYNTDGVAEANSSSVTTSSALDGSNYVMHSMAYAALYSMTVGLPNNGLVSSSTRTYQLRPYNQNNVLFVTTGLTDSIVFVTPAQYNAVSVIGYATEGAGTMSVTILFTDNTTQTYTNIGLPDWFTGTNNILNGFGRTNRTTGVISTPAAAPNLYTVDFNLSCANRLKNIRHMRFSNTGTNPRLVLMGVAGATNAATITATSAPVNCVGGTNGSASVSVSGGTPPFTYSWTTSPSQTSAQANNLSVGTYSCIVTDAGGCNTTKTVAVTQSLTTQPSLFLSTNATSVCSGNTVAIAASGANTFSWSTGSTLQLITVTPNSNTTYTVSGYSSSNCLLTGSIAITVFNSPVVSLSSIPPSFCINSPTFAFSGSPLGGTYTGLGLIPGGFDPSVAGVGTATFSYNYTDANNCSGTATAITVINALPSVSFSLSTTAFCDNSPAFSLTGGGSPSGGSFSGPGVSGSLFTPATAGTGSSTITYSYTDANNCANTATASAVVYSLAAPSVSVAKSFYCVNAISVIVFGSPAGGTFSGPGINSGGLFSPATAGVGTHTITYSITSAPCTSAKSITLTVSNCDGLPEYNQNLFSLYPNPNNGSFFVKSDKDIQLEVINELGQVLVKTGITRAESGKVLIENLPVGLYFVKAQSGNISSLQKVLITK